jgi:radical SAM superfamily enzyme YgiQ (UPF0313 family)
MNILIVVPKYSLKSLNTYYDFPIALAYISSTLKHAGYSVDILNLNTYYGYIQDRNWGPLEMLLSKKLKKKRYDLLCTGGMSPHFDQIMAISNKAKSIQPGIITIVGGNLISSMPESVMEALQADFGVIGEGEETILELVQVLQDSSRNIETVTGLVHLDRSGKAVKNKPRVSLNDINTIPFPDYDGFDAEKCLSQQLPMDHSYRHPYDQPRLMPIVASRSCVYKCTFCFHPEGQKYRQRSLDSVFLEIDYLVSNFGVNMISLEDELLGTDKQRLLDFSERIRPYNIKWGCQLHISNTLTQELLRAMKDSGCMCISYGLESACDVVLKSMKKRITVTQMEAGLRDTYEAGLLIIGNFIFGDKGETLDTALETLTWWFMHREYGINLSRVVPYPGSELFNYACSIGMVTDKIEALRNECELLLNINISGMTTEQLDYFNYLCGLYFQAIGRIPARVISARKTGTIAKKGSIYSLTIKCPKCNCVITYNNMHSRPTPWKNQRLERMGCRECGQRYDIFPFDMEAKILSILGTTTQPNVAIFKADKNAFFLLNNSIRIKELTRHIIETDFTQLAHKEDNLQIIPLHNNEDYIKVHIETVIVTTTSGYHELTSLANLKSLGVELLDLSEYFSELPVFQNTEQGIYFIADKIEGVNDHIVRFEFEQAYSKMLSLIELMHDFSPLHVWLAEIALRLNDLETAYDAICTADFLSPNDPEIMHKLNNISSIFERSDNTPNSKTNNIGG